MILDDKRPRTGMLAALVLVAASFAHAESPYVAENLDEVERLVTRAEDIEAIKQLTYVYGYYRDALRRDDMLELFADDAVYDVGNGQYVGKESIRRLFYSDRLDVPVAVSGNDAPTGVLNDHAMMQGVITLSEDGLSAKARFKDFGFEAVDGESEMYVSSMYENSYVKEDGVWKFAEIKHCYRLKMPYHSSSDDFPDSVIVEPVPTFYPEDAEGPDRQSNVACHRYPAVGINPPFHFDHPVTGERIQKP